jgi:hypothetical protein
MTDDQPVSFPRDPVVARVNSLVTTFLDAAGALLIAAALGWGSWQAWGLGWGLAAAGSTVMLMSSVAQARANPRPARLPKGAHPHPDQPGPQHPGNLHVMGPR